MHAPLPSRRDLLKAGGALIIGFSLGSRPGSSLAQQAASTKTVAPNEVDAFLSIDAKGNVTVYSGKVDLGTGVRTALSQIVAEELDVPLDSIEIIQGDTELTPDQGPTSGSLSIQNGGMQIRQAAATARGALLDLAAKRLDVQKSALALENATVRAGTDGKRVSYAELIGGKAFALTLDTNAPTKNPGSFTVVGKSVPRLDIPAKVFGQFTYIHDFRVRGMLHGRVVRPPAIGADLQSVDESSIHDIPGAKVVRHGNFLGVLAETEWDTIRAATKLKAEWSSWSKLPDQNRLWEHVRATKIVKEETTSDIGNAPDALAQAPRKFAASYQFAIHTHGSIGPSCAIAAISDGKLTCWSASQAPHNLRKQLAAMLSMPEGEIHCIYLEGSGCYGRNGHEDAAADAALLARAAGRPVRVQWMRHDEHGWDPKGPPTLIDVRAGLDTDGNVVAWHSEFFLPQAATGSVELIAAGLAGLPHETMLATGNISQNSAIPYAFPNIRSSIHRLESTPLRPAWIRTPGRLQNTFANESFLNELATAAGVDPLEYRLRYLKDPRGIELLKRLAELAHWQKQPPANSSTGVLAEGRGMAYVKYDLARTYVGAVADVKVDRRTGGIHVARIYVVHDCGQVINPDGVKNQIEGNIVQTLSRTLKEELKFDRSRVTSLDWESYPILGFPEVPDVIIELIDRPTEKPWGAGEPSAAVVPAAISNAVFQAVGARLRSVPFLPSQVRAAMENI